MFVFIYTVYFCLVVTVIWFKGYYSECLRYDATDLWVVHVSACPIHRDMVDRKIVLGNTLMYVCTYSLVLWSEGTLLYPHTLVASV